MKKVTVLLFLGASLAGCDNPPTCKDRCPNPKESRDFFCDCFDPSKNKPAATGTPNEPSSTTPSAFSQCICQYSNGQVGAWFNYKPPIYGTMGQVTVSASTCTDLTVCELTKTADGGDQYTYLTGKLNIVPDSWNDIKNFVTGGESWSVLGRVSSRVTDSGAPKYTPVGPRFAFMFKHWLRQSQPAAFTNTPEECNVACDNGSPYCLNDNLSAQEASGLRRLYGVLMQKPNSISTNSLQQMFGLSQDQCERGETEIQNGKLFNSGTSCNISTSIPQIGTIATLQVPSSLAGNYSVSPRGMITLEIPDPDRRPKLRFFMADGKTPDSLDSDWGGPIKFVFGDSQNIGLSVGASSCVRMQFH